MSEAVTTSVRDTSRCSKGLVRYRWTLLPLALVTFAISWRISRELTFDRSIESLYADDDPQLQNYLESKSLFGGDELAFVAWTEPELFAADTQELTPEADARIRQFAQKLNAVPGVLAKSTQDLATASEKKKVRYLIPVNVPMPRDLLHFLVRGVLLGHDDQTTAIVLRLEPQKAASVPRSETLADIRKIADEFSQEHSRTVHLVGEPVQVEETFRYVEDDGQSLFLVSLCILAVVLVALFRSLWWAVLPLIIVIITIRWTEAILVLSGLQLSMVSSMLNSLVTIIGVATLTHIAVHFRELRHQGDQRVTLLRTFSRLLPAIFWTCMTTAVGFAALLTSHLNPVKSFGFMMSIATILVLVAVGTIVPACVLLPGFSMRKSASTSQASLSYALTQVTHGVKRFPGWLTFGFLGIVIAASWGFTRLQVETDFSKNFRDSSPIVQGLHFFEDPEHFAGAGSWEVNFPAPEYLTDDYLAKVKILTEQLRKEFQPNDEDRQLTKVLSITDATENFPTYWFLPNPLPVELKMSLLKQLQPEFVTNLYNPDQKRMRILLRARERQPADAKLALIARVENVTQTWAAEHLTKWSDKPTVKVTGLYVLLANLIQSLLSDQVVSFCIAGFGIGGMLIVAFRSLKFGLIALIPNVFPIVFVVGGMGWLNLPVNIATAMIASVSMGLTVDSSIHYISGYRRARRDGLSVDEALQQTHAGVGRALVFANIALIAGFSVLTLSHFIPLIYFGVLVSVAMLGGLIGNLLLLPLLLGWAERTSPKTSP